MYIFESPKGTKIASSFREITNFSKTELQTIFLSLASAGQNQISGLHAKKSGVIFFKPKSLEKKHSDL